jgi:AP2-associated kinase
MANLVYPGQLQNKGTLLPGQTITVNKYTVQVERYLSQGMFLTVQSVISLTLPAGGFAHVYLVRTATPVHNTTHHVLKRIAVANEGMLSEVKKEVDIMVRTCIM